MSQDVHGEALPGGNRLSHPSCATHPDNVAAMQAAVLIAEMLMALRLARRIFGNLVVLEIEEAIAKAERLGL